MRREAADKVTSGGEQRSRPADVLFAQSQSYTWAAYPLLGSRTR